MKFTGEAAHQSVRSMESEIKELKLEIESLKKERENQKRFMRIDQEKAEINRLTARKASIATEILDMESKAKKDGEKIISDAQAEAGRLIQAAQDKGKEIEDQASAKMIHAEALRDSWQKKNDSLISESSELEKRKSELNELRAAHDLQKKGHQNQAKDLMKTLQGFTNG